MARARRPRPRTTTARRTATRRPAARRPGRAGPAQKRKLGRKRQYATAIDIGHYSVKIVTVAMDEAGQVQVQRATVQPLDRPSTSGQEIKLNQAQVAALKAALHHHGRLSGRVALALPRGLSTIRYLTLPSSDYEELKEMILLDAERHIPFPIDEVEIDFEVIEQLGEHESSVMMVSAPRLEIYAFLDLCREAGVIPQAVDIDILGACQAYRESGDREETKAIIDFGRESTCLGIMSRGQILFTRSLSASESRLLSGFPGARNWGDLRTRLAAIGALPPQDRTKVETWIGELYVDLMRSVSAFACDHSGARVNRIILCGGGAYLPSGPSDTLAVRLKTKALVEQPLDGDLPADPSYQGPELAAVLGVALRALHGNGQAINLLPSEMVAERERQEQRAFFKSAAFLALLTFVCAGAGLYLKWEKKYSQLVELRNQIEAIKPETESLQQMSYKIRIVDTYLDREHSCLTVLAAVLDSLPSQPPHNVALRRMDFQKRETLRLEGQTRTPEDINSVSNILVEMGPQLLPGKTKIFRSVNPRRQEQRDLGFDGLKAWDFTFECDLDYAEFEQERQKVRDRLQRNRRQ